MFQCKKCKRENAIRWNAYGEARCKSCKEPTVVTPALFDEMGALTQGDVKVYCEKITRRCEEEGQGRHVG